jgi:hypothetical protein
MIQRSLLTVYRLLLTARNRPGELAKEERGLAGC